GESGYGVFVYEFGIAVDINESTLDARSKETESVAAKYKAKILNDKQSTAEVLEEVIRYNAQTGQTVHSGFYFIPDIEYPGASESEKDVQSPPYLLSILRDTKADPMEVRMTDGRSYFFMYESFKQ